MYNKAPVIPIETYYKDMQSLSNQIIGSDYDCIIALKRSGWILGAFLSNQKTLPLFTVSEMKSIPPTFNRFLIVDDKICTGKSFNKVKHKLPLLVELKTACLYVERDVYTDIYIKEVGEIVKMWYERN
jgi:hypoxanthine phosphoribosyltransferase